MIFRFNAGLGVYFYFQPGIDRTTCCRKVASGTGELESQQNFTSAHEARKAFYRKK